MSEFRFQNKPKPKQSNTDGFINPRQPTSDNLRVRFRQNYSPAQFESARTQRPVQSEFLSKDIKTSQEAFHSNKTDFSKQVSADQNLDLRLDEELPKSAKRRWFGLRKAKNQKPKRSVGKRIARGFAVFFFVLLLGLSSIFGYVFLKQRQIFNGSGDGAAALGKNVTPSQLNGEGDGRVNILLAGKGGPGHEAPDLTDTLLLASIDPVQNEAAMVSVPRDLYVQDANGYSTKINAIYSNAKQARLSQSSQQNDAEAKAAEDAGLSALKQKVSEVLGVPVHYYVMVDFTAFKEAIDTVGGITIDVKEQLYDQTMAWMNGGNPLIADVGMQAFDGNRALMYARSRHGSARGDFDRSERQKEVIF
ncbi:MAG TPA: LCP family protein, partial [Candidatus Saccharibacteria bacterium]|nr:LCP family protein [Candidatus Saccharibacteria bacterium]